MCPKEDGVTAKLFVVTALAEWHGERHFCQPTTQTELQHMLESIICGTGCAVLRLVPEGVPFGVGLSVGKLVFKPNDMIPFTVEGIPDRLTPFLDVFPMKHIGRRNKRGRGR